MKIRQKLIQLIFILAILLGTTAFAVAPPEVVTCPLSQSISFEADDLALWVCSVKLPPVQPNVAWNK